MLSYAVLEALPITGRRARLRPLLWVVAALVALRYALYRWRSGSAQAHRCRALIRQTEEWPASPDQGDVDLVVVDIFGAVGHALDVALEREDGVKVRGATAIAGLSPCGTPANRQDPRIDAVLDQILRWVIRWRSPARWR